MKDTTYKKEEFKIIFRLPEELYERIEKESRLCNMTKSNYVRNILSKNQLNYYTKSPEIIKQVCEISTEINHLKFKNPDINLDKLEQECGKLCVMLNS